MPANGIAIASNLTGANSIVFDVILEQSLVVILTCMRVRAAVPKKCNIRGGYGRGKLLSNTTPYKFIGISDITLKSHRKTYDF